MGINGVIQAGNVQALGECPSRCCQWMSSRGLFLTLPLALAYTAGSIARWEALSNLATVTGGPEGCKPASVAILIPTHSCLRRWLPSMDYSVSQGMFGNVWRQLWLS